MQEHFDVGAMMGKALLIVADVFHNITRDLDDHIAVNVGFAAVLVKQRCLAAALVCNTEFDVVSQECIEDCIRDLVTDLVGMSFGYGLARKLIILAPHFKGLPSRIGLQLAHTHWSLAPKRPATERYQVDDCP